MTAAVSVKLPPFWHGSPTAWFIQAEAQFALRGVTVDDTKYYHVVAVLDTETANRALSILTAPPADNKYGTLKNFLLSAFDKTEEERASLLFNLTGLGDNKPSELMDKMLALLGDHEPCFLFRHIFLTQLPDFVRTSLANSKNKNNPRALALEADQLVIASTHVAPTPNVHQVRHHRVTPQADVCSYHRRFGNNARKCLEPCKFSQRFKQNQGNGSTGQ